MLHDLVILIPYNICVAFQLGKKSQFMCELFDNTVIVSRHGLICHSTRTIGSNIVIALRN